MDLGCANLNEPGASNSKLLRILIEASDIGLIILFGVLIF
jgi:hypothetical protein